jgi:hypothetical protein
MRTFTTQDITDVDLDQIIITKTKDIDGNPQVRVRANVSVTLVDSLDPLRTSTINLNLNKTIQELSVGPAVNAIRLAVLNSLKSQIQ